MGAEELPKIRTTARRGRPDLLPYSLLLPSLVLLLVFFTVPLIMIVVFSFYTRDPLGSMIPALTLENYRKFFTEALYQVVLLKSLRFAATATVVTLLLGYPMAYFLARTKSRRLFGPASLFAPTPGWSCWAITGSSTRHWPRWVWKRCS
jgi:ABC-type spermidine/putrescine transport system permease subunit I